MSNKIKDVLKGVGLAFLTMVCMLGITPWTLVSSILGCVVAVFVIWRIFKRKKEELPVVHFTVSYVAAIVIFVIILNSISISA